MRNGGVFGVTGCFGSALLAKYVPKAEALKIPFVGFYSGPNFVGNPIKHYVFGTRTDFETEENQVIWHPLFVMNSGSNVDALLDVLGKEADGQLFTEVVPPFIRVDLPMIGQFTKLLKQYYPNAKPGFINLRGYANATVWVEALKRAGKNPTRERFISALEGIHNWDQGLGKGMELSYSPTNHLGRSAVFFCVTREGAVAMQRDWKKLKK